MEDAVVAACRAFIVAALIKKQRKQRNRTVLGMGERVD